MSSIFTKTVKVPEVGILKFTFSKAYTLDGEKYFVSAVDKDNTPYVFYLRKHLGTWKFDRSKQAIPETLELLEQEFAAVIRRQLENPVTTEL